jgi:hypothetical protein
MCRASRLNISLAVFLSLCFVLSSGCSDNLPRRVHVSGHVFIDGKPLEYGVIQVYPQDQRMAEGTIGPGGKFTLTTFTEDDGCMMGKHPVAINAAKGISSTSTQWFAPKKYANAATSGLTMDVSGPIDDVIINLTWDGGKPFTEKL